MESEMEDKVITVDNVEVNLSDLADGRFCWSVYRRHQARASVAHAVLMALTPEQEEELIKYQEVKGND